MHFDDKPLRHYSFVNLVAARSDRQGLKQFHVHVKRDYVTTI
jgi:hypothetical protein